MTSLIIACTGEQRRTIRELTKGTTGWILRITPSTGPAELLELLRGDTRYVVARDGTVIADQ